MNWSQEIDSVERRKAKEALKEAKKLEQKQLKKGYRYKWINSKTQVLSKD